MNQEGWCFWKRGKEKDAGGDSLERSGSESPPASPPPEGEVAESHREMEVVGDVVSAAPSHEGSDGDTSNLQARTLPDGEGQLDPGSVFEWEDDPPPAAANLSARRRGTLSKPFERPVTPISPQQKLLLLDTWLRSGLPARDFAGLVNVSRHTLYAWKRRFQQLGPAGVMEQPRGRRSGSRLPELTKRTILMLKQAHPEWGCQRISDMLLRGPALPASATAVARVLHEAG